MKLTRLNSQVCERGSSPHYLRLKAFVTETWSVHCDVFTDRRRMFCDATVVQTPRYEELYVVSDLHLGTACCAGPQSSAELSTLQCSIRRFRFTHDPAPIVEAA